MFDVTTFHGIVQRSNLFRIFTMVIFKVDHHGVSSPGEISYFWLTFELVLHHQFRCLLAVPGFFVGSESAF